MLANSFLATKTRSRVRPQCASTGLSAVIQFYTHIACLAALGQCLTISRGYSLLSNVVPKRSNRVKLSKTENGMRIVSRFEPCPALPARKLK